MTLGGVIVRDAQEVIRREVTQGMAEAAEAQDVPIYADAAAVVSQRDLLLVNAPASGIDELDFKGMLEGRSVLSDAPLMYWYLAGDAFRDKSFPLAEGFYAVVADPERGSVALRDAEGRTFGDGDLVVDIDPSGPATATTAKIIGGGIKSADATLWPPRVKVCGFVKVKEKGVTVTITACVSVGF